MKNWFTIACLCTISFSVVGTEQLVIKKGDPIDHMHNSPLFVYKILSLRNWQATQARKAVQLSAEEAPFIQFYTEEQLKTIIEKEWADAPQLIILKIDSKKLEGRLLFETNRDGTTRDYHLYDGFIPFSSIVESRVVYQQPIENCEEQKLEIVQVGDPVLRQRARELSIEEIKSREIQELIEIMKATMRAAPGVGLAAPQIGKPIQLAVIEDMDLSYLNEEQLAARDRRPVPFHVVINPKLYIEESSDEAVFFEGCLSVPEFVGIVPRAKSVLVECLNEQGEAVVIQAKGWYARILQHEIDHLNGTLYIDKAELPTLMTTENYLKLHKQKSIEEIQATFLLNEKEKAQD